MARAKSYKPTAAERESIDTVVKAINECKRWHEPFARKIEKRYSAYRGMSVENAPATWRSNVQQPLLINTVEGMLSSMEDAEPTWDVTGRILPDMEIDEALEQTENAEYAGYLLAHQMRCDDFAFKQGPFMLQDLIVGYTPGKVRWLKEQALRRYVDSEEGFRETDDGGTIELAEIIDLYEEDRLVRNDPSFEPRDARDFMWPESAVSLDAAPYVIDRTFVTYKTLLKMEQLDIYKDVEFLKDNTRRDDEQDKRVQSSADIVKDREQKLRAVDRTRGLVEIVEYWTDEEVITVGNRSVLLRRRSNPNFMGKKPFIIVSAIPDAFQIPGISVIEGLAQMQEMLWTLQNTRLDATRMAANLIQVIRGDVENSEEFEWAPNAQWFVRSLDDVKLLDIPTDVLRATLESEGLLRGDLQAVMGALPFQGGASSQTFDPQTATGMSIVTNIAQAVLGRRKQHYARAFGKLGGMFLSLDHQLIRSDRLVEIFGENGARRFMEINPKQLKGIYDVEIRWEDDSMLRQEKRAESGVLLTNAMEFGPVSAQMGVKINAAKFWERHLKAYGVTNPQEYFSEMGSTGVIDPATGQPGGGQGTAPSPETLMGEMAGGETSGVTNPEAAAGPTSPSNANSMSGVSAMQQMLATNGGAGRQA